MSDAPARDPNVASLPARGQLHKFLPLPIIPHHAQWFEAGPVTFAVEVRIIQEPGKGPNRSESIHVFNAARTEEYARFDEFDDFPHYHYILNKPQHNIVWGYDHTVNGPMTEWALSIIESRLSSVLRAAQAEEIADQVEREGFDLSVLDKMRAAVAEWEPRPAEEIMAETREWGMRWKQLHPQFNTAG